MFNKKLKKAEAKIEDMSIWLDAWISTCEDEINFYNTLLESDDPSTQRFAKGQIELEQRTLFTLKDLRNTYDTIIKRD